MREIGQRIPFLANFTFERIAAFKEIVWKLSRQLAGRKVQVRIPRDADQRSELMPITIPK
jgi:hypothetical protein